MNEVPKKSGKYGFLDGKSANGLYKEYKKYCGSNNVECMPFPTWLTWAQERGIVQKLSADASELGSGQFMQLAVSISDTGINRLYLEMAKAKKENWDSEKLKSITNSAGAPLGISDQKILGLAMSILQDEMKRRGIELPENPSPETPDPTVSKPVNTKKIIAGVLISVLAVSVIAACVSSSTKG